MLLEILDLPLGKEFALKKITLLELIFNFIYLCLSFFSGSDPNQHILDTLEQCISVIIEKLHRLDQDKNGSRLSSMDLDKSIEGIKNSKGFEQKVSALGFKHQT